MPVTQNVSIGQQALYRCHHETADVIRWRVNGTLLSNSMTPIGITPGTLRATNNNLVQTLTIAGRTDYNGTAVICVAMFDDGNDDETTDAAFLYVNGLGKFNSHAGIQQL